MNRLNKLLERFLAWQRSKRIRREAVGRAHPKVMFTDLPTAQIEQIKTSVKALKTFPLSEIPAQEDWPEIIE